MNQASLIKHLEDRRGFPIPKATFYDWLRVCGIVPKGRNLKGYSLSDIDRLERLVCHLRLGGCYEEFQQILIEEESRAYQVTNANPIECCAVEV